MKTKYTQRKDGEGWQEKSHRVFKLACCDCGLVHDVVIVAGKPGRKVGIAAKRNPRATGQRRRHASENAQAMASADEKTPPKETTL